MTLYIFIIFVLTYYLGLVGFTHPWKSISIVNSIAFILLIASLIKNFSLKIYLLPSIFIIISFLWSRYIIHLPLYGRYVFYNPFSVFGIGKEFYGKKIEPLETCQGEIKEKIKIENIYPHNLLTYIYSLIIEIISLITFVFGFTWTLTGANFVNIFTNITAFIIRTILKSTFGYVPKNEKLSHNKFYQYIQDRVYSNNITSQLAAIVRRYTLMGIDMDALDSIFESKDYNNVYFNKNVKEMCQGRENYLKNKEKATLLEQWKWETYPYAHHWIKLSIIVYVFYLAMKIKTIV
jgi:hypothetical protein